MAPLLAVSELTVEFATSEQPICAVDGVSFSLERGEVLGIVGESGSGKSVTARSIIGLHEPGHITHGSIRFDGTELVDAPQPVRRAHRGSAIGMVFQDPATTLNPVLDVGEQIAESLSIHEGESQSLLDFLHVPGVSDSRSWRRHRERAADLLEDVGLSDPDDRVQAYPHQLSGGERQRVLLAIALAGDPELLIVDEPTTALDTTTQKAVLERLKTLASKTDTAVLIISHDFDVISEICDQTLVFYGGQIMERGPTNRLLDTPAHPYTRGLLGCLLDGTAPAGSLPTIPGSVPDRFPSHGCPFRNRCEYATASCEQAQPTIDLAPGHDAVCGELERVESHRSASSPKPNPAPLRSATNTEFAQESSAPPVLEARGVSKTYQLRDSLFERLLGGSKTVTALKNVDFTVHPGETVGVVGESGSGKSTLKSLLAGIEAPSSGTIYLDGEQVGTISDRTDSQLAQVGTVFQSARESINPRLTIRQVIAEPLCERGWDRKRRDDRVADLLERLNLDHIDPTRRPHELSGGQLQRVAIARAIVLEPDVVLFDEPVSALDVSVRASLLNLLADLQSALDLSYVFISHDLSVVGHVADRVLVMEDGEICERGPTSRVFTQPTHPATEALLETITEKASIQ